MITRGLGALIVNRLGISWPTTGSEGSWFRDIFKATIGDMKVPLGFLWVTEEGKQGHYNQQHDHLLSAQPRHDGLVGCIILSHVSPPIC